MFHTKRADCTDKNVSEHAMHMLVNLSGDSSVLETLATNDKFVQVIFKRIVVCV